MRLSSILWRPLFFIIHIQCYQIQKAIVRQSTEKNVNPFVSLGIFWIFFFQPIKPFIYVQTQTTFSHLVRIVLWYKWKASIGLSMLIRGISYLSLAFWINSLSNNHDMKFILSWNSWWMFIWITCHFVLSS